jgi:hypothetical protein|tara:strand:- start:520 stop:804 length:285 start_codon:yes stop_codon:yes gene_type:complete
MLDTPRARRAFGTRETAGYANTVGTNLVWDGEVKGFGARCWTGGARFYMLNTDSLADDGGSRLAGTTPPCRICAGRDMGRVSLIACWHQVGGWR